MNAVACLIKVDNEEDADKSFVVTRQDANWLSTYDEKKK